MTRSQLLPEAYREAAHSHLGELRARHDDDDGPGLHGSKRRIDKRALENYAEGL